MLNRRDSHIVAADRRRHTRIDDNVRAQRDVDRGLQVDATEHDPSVGGRRAQHQFNLRAAVQADADGPGLLPERELLQHFVIVTRLLVRCGERARHGRHRIASLPPPDQP